MIGSKEQSQNQFIKDFCNQIIKVGEFSLFLGGISSLIEPVFENLKIQAVITILDPFSYEYYKVKQTLQKLSVSQQKWFKLEDDESVQIKPYFCESNQFIKHQISTTNILVHCRGGVSRSAALVLAYLMKRHNLNLSDSLSFLRSKRKCVEPNSSFIKDLQAYQKQLGFNAININI